LAAAEFAGMGRPAVGLGFAARFGEEDDGGFHLAGLGVPLELRGGFLDGLKNCGELCKGCRG